MRPRLVVLLLCLVPAIAYGESRFVELEVTLRSGQGTGFSIVRMVRSGSPVEVLETNAATGYSRVRVPGGTEGWMLTRYLTDSPVGAEALIAARQRVDQLSRENRELIEERNRLMSEGDDLAGELQRLKDLSADAIALEQTKQRLATAVKRQEQTIAELESENARLKSKSGRDWFLAGAGVLVAGLLFGLILPRIRWQRRRKWNDL